MMCPFWQAGLYTKVLFIFNQVDCILSYPKKLNHIANIKVTTENIASSAYAGGN